MPIFADDGGKNQHSSEKDDCFKNKTFKFYYSHVLSKNIGSFLKKC